MAVEPHAGTRPAGPVPARGEQTTLELWPMGTGRCRVPLGSMEHLLSPGDQVLGSCRDRYASGLAELRSEEHTSELQSHSDLVCRLLLEKKKKLVETGFSPTDAAWALGI